MAFPLLRKAPERLQEVKAEALLAALAMAAQSVGLVPRPGALPDLVDALAAGAPLPLRPSVGRRSPEPPQIALDGLRTRSITCLPDSVSRGSRGAAHSQPA